MFDQLMRLLERKRDADPAERERVIRTATAALLVEMVRADSTVLGEEAEALSKVLSRHFGMSADEVASLVSTAEREADAAVSLYTFIKQLNGTLDVSEKSRVIELLWHIALADESLDRYEESLVRKVADLLKLSSAEVLRTKALVQGALAKR